MNQDNRTKEIPLFHTWCCWLVLNSYSLNSWLPCNASYHLELLLTGVEQVILNHITGCIKYLNGTRLEEKCLYPAVITLFLLLLVTFMPYGAVMAPTFSQLPVLLSYFWSVVYILRRKLNRDYDDFNHDDGVFVVPITLPTPSSALAASRQPPPNYSTAVLYPPPPDYTVTKVQESKPNWSPYRLGLLQSHISESWCNLA